MARIQKTTFYDQAYKILKRDIMAGRYQPGERLTDQKLAEDLGISRTPVREAILQLVREGFLINEPNRGVSVFNPTSEDIAEIYAFRAPLEGMAAALAAANPDRHRHTQQMKAVLLNAQRSIKAGKVAELAESNLAFHDLILEASGSQRLRNLLEPMRTRSTSIRYYSLSAEAHARVSEEEHNLLLRIIDAGNVEEARQQMEAHVLKAGYRMVMRFAQDFDPESPLFRFYKERVAKLQ